MPERWTWLGGGESPAEKVDLSALVDALEATDVQHGWLLPGFHGQDRYVQPDAVLLGPGYLVVVEHKGWSGRLQVTKDGWTAGTSRLGQDPDRQAQSNAMQLKSALKDQLPNVSPYVSTLVWMPRISSARLPKPLRSRVCGSAGSGLRDVAGAVQQQKRGNWDATDLEAALDRILGNGSAIAVPKLRGLTEQAAQDLCEHDRLRLRVGDPLWLAPGAEAEVAQVQAQSPPPGERVAAGSDVVVRLGRIAPEEQQALSACVTLLRQLRDPWTESGGPPTPPQVLAAAKLVTHPGRHYLHQLDPGALAALSARSKEVELLHDALESSAASAAALEVHAARRSLQARGVDPSLEWIGDWTPVDLENHRRSRSLHDRIAQAEEALPPGWPRKLRTIDPVDLTLQPSQLPLATALTAVKTAQALITDLLAKEQLAVELDRANLTDRQKSRLRKQLDRVERSIRAALHSLGDLAAPAQECGAHGISALLRARELQAETFREAGFGPRQISRLLTDPATFEAACVTVETRALLAESPNVPGLPSGPLTLTECDLDQALVSAAERMRDNLPKLGDQATAVQRIWTALPEEVQEVLLGTGEDVQRWQALLDICSESVDADLSLLAVVALPGSVSDGATDLLNEACQAYRELPQMHSFLKRTDLSLAVDTPEPTEDAPEQSARQRPQPAIVPDLVELMSIEQARSVLEECGLRLGDSRLDDGPYPEGRVLRQAPSPPATLARGQAVSVVVASGMNRVPSVLDLELQSASTQLTRAGYVVSTHQLVSTRPVYRVLDTDPRPGERLAVGSTVTVTIACPPVHGTVPRVTGERADRAERLIREAGFVARYTQDSRQDGTGTVARQWPEPGSSEPFGSGVRMYVAPAEQPNVPPPPPPPPPPSPVGDGSTVGLSPSAAAGDGPKRVSLLVEMRRSYLDYAMSVIVSRALPDVRDGLKPVHRRVLYAMYDGGYRPDRNFSKSARVVGDVMGSYHPHGDSAIYDALVRLAQPWSLRYPLVQGPGSRSSPGPDPPAAQRYTECRMAPLAMEMVRDIDEETVDFTPNYDGRSLEPVVLPTRFPNLLVNGSAGIAVGMATNIPPHNLREIASAVHWLLENPAPRRDKSTMRRAEELVERVVEREERLAALMERVKGPDFPTGALIVGKHGIKQAYRTGRGSITMRAVVTVEEDSRGRTHLLVTELPYQVNPDNLLLSIAEQVSDGKITGISDVRDDSSSRTGMRLIIELKRDAVAQVVLNNLYKHTQLQTTFGANMLALVDGVPRTLTLEQFVRYWITHQIEVVQRRTRYRLRKAEERAHILRGYLKALDALDEVIALIRASATVEDAREGLMRLLEIDELQATAILDMQLRRLAALERQKIVDEFDDLMAKIADYNDILASEVRQREIVSTELAEIVDKYGDDRRTSFVPWDGDVTDEDLIAEEDVVVTITSGGYAKRTRTDLYRAQRRGGKGVKGAQLRQDDVVEHFFVTTTHHWILFFTNTGRVYRAKAYQLPEAGRDARGQHVANLLAFQPDETIAQVLYLRDYVQAPYLVLATRSGQVKKTRLTEYDTARTGGIIAINLADGDELISAQLVSEADDLILLSRKGMSTRFSADDGQLRPMGRATSGVIGMRFRGSDALLTMDVVRQGAFVVTVTDGGYAKRTPVDDWSTKGRGGLGVRAMRLVEERGSLVGGLVCDADDEIYAVGSHGVVIRTRVEEIRASARDTMGVKLMDLSGDDTVVAVARAEADDDESDAPEGADEAPDAPSRPDSGHNGPGSPTPDQA